MIGLLLIGDEILSASVREANLYPMLSSLSGIGYTVGEVRIVRDEPQEIAQAFRELQRRYEYVISAGGIGPTHDDLTLAAAAVAFDEDLVEQSDMKRFLETRYGLPLTPMVARMAHMPRHTQIIHRDDGHWPLIRWNNVFILPGLPEALKDKIRRITEILPPREHVWQSVIFLSEDESVFADWLRDVQANLQRVAIGSYPVVREPDYRTRLVLRSVDRAAVQEASQSIEAHVRSAGWFVRREGDA